MPFESHGGTTLERCGTIPPEYAASWIASMPYFNVARSIISFCELPENDTHLTDEAFKTIRHLSSCSNAEAKRRADGGDAEAAIDYGLRLLVGFQCTQSCLAAMRYFIRVLDGITSNPRLIAKAHICAAMPLLDICAWANGKSTPTEKQFSTVGYHYNEAAKLGFGKCAALLHFMQILYPRRQEIKSSHLWTAMWAVFEERVAEMDAERRKVGEKLAKRPNRYVCAAKACGIAANTGKVFLRCSGKCSNDYKPYYCSTECQRKDWKLHKPYCTLNKPPPPTHLPAHHPGKAQEGIRSISIPRSSGQGTMQISSSTFDVDDLKRLQRINAEK